MPRGAARIVARPGGAQRDSRSGRAHVRADRLGAQRPDALREFLRTETGGAAILLAAAIAALVWANVDASSYERFWSTILSIDLGGHGISLDLRHWINSGLMTFFFFVVGLEARREFDLGELRERRRFVLPLLAALAGIAVPITIYVLFNAGSTSAHGWGVAMSTDTAFALGALALVGPRFPDRLRAFMLTMSVVDDLVALAVIATVYTEDLRLELAARRRGRVRPPRRAHAARGPPRPRLPRCSEPPPGSRCSSRASSPSSSGSPWVCSRTPHPPPALDLERATELLPPFPRAADPRARARGAGRAPLRRSHRTSGCSDACHPWTSYVIVPALRARERRRRRRRGDICATRFTSPITLGILLGYVRREAARDLRVHVPGRPG